MTATPIFHSSYAFPIHLTSRSCTFPHAGVKSRPGKGWQNMKQSLSHFRFGAPPACRPDLVMGNYPDQTVIRVYKGRELCCSMVWFLPSVPFRASFLVSRSSSVLASQTTLLTSAVRSLPVIPLQIQLLYTILKPRGRHRVKAAGCTDVFRVSSPTSSKCAL